MQIQTHRYALEQGALCVHVLYLEYIPTGIVMQDLGKNKRDPHQWYCKNFTSICMIFEHFLHGSWVTLTRFLQILAKILHGPFKVLQESCMVLVNSCKNLAWSLKTLARILHGSCKLLQESCMVLVNSCKNLTWSLKTLARILHGPWKLLQEYCMVLENSCKIKNLAWSLCN